jgi:hypothetical protein
MEFSLIGIRVTIMNAHTWFSPYLGTLEMRWGVLTGTPSSFQPHMWVKQVIDGY